MLQYREYLSHLDVLIRAAISQGLEFHQPQIKSALNGGAASALRESVSIQSLKDSGAFFTPESLSRLAVNSLPRNLLKGPVYDPACGAGDLLLRWAEKLPICGDLEETIEQWGKLLGGADIHPEFVAAAKRRLLLLALSRGAMPSTRKRIKADAYFPNLIVSDFLQTDSKLPKATILLNPPFNQSVLEKKLSWSTGRISLAAVFFAKCLDSLPEGQNIAAILPDVLRSGSRYFKWRNVVEKRLTGTKLASVGRFSPHADVDVFIISGKRSTDSSAIHWRTHKQGIHLESLCQVKVGTVVPHRDSLSGPKVRYLTAASLPPNSECSGGAIRRVASNTTQPPFVAVRRTSSPSDKQRPVAALVIGKGEVALENHLISLKPHDGTIASCRKILEILASPNTRSQLDDDIRCRHLTVAALRKITIEDNP